MENTKTQREKEMSIDEIKAECKRLTIAAIRLQAEGDQIEAEVREAKGEDTKE